MAEVEAPKSRKRIEPWTVREISDSMKPLKAFYEKVSKGLKTIPADDLYVERTKGMAIELLARQKKILEDYAELYESTKSKRTANLKPVLCDRKLTTFIGAHFGFKLPETALHGVIDLNRIVPRAFSLYIKEKGLGNGQVFVLDSALKQLFESPSIEIPQKTYLQLALDRINEIRSTKDYKPSASSADIHIDHATGKVSMNYSALKIVIPKFGISYDITNPEEYILSLETFAKNLEQILIGYKEAQKKSKKTQE